MRLLLSFLLLRGITFIFIYLLFIVSFFIFILVRYGRGLRDALASAFLFVASMSMVYRTVSSTFALWRIPQPSPSSALVEGGSGMTAAVVVGHPDPGKYNFIVLYCYCIRIVGAVHCFFLCTTAVKR